jgi:hypothetical protein
MTDQEIAAAMLAIVAAIPQERPPTPIEAAALAAGMTLLTNLLQNINTIAQASKQS